MEKNSMFFFHQKHFIFSYQTAHKTPPPLECLQIYIFSNMHNRGGGGNGFLNINYFLVPFPFSFLCFNQFNIRNFLSLRTKFWGESTFFFERWRNIQYVFHFSSPKKRWKWSVLPFFYIISAIMLFYFIKFSFYKKRFEYIP